MDETLRASESSARFLRVEERWQWKIADAMEKEQRKGRDAVSSAKSEEGEGMVSFRWRPRIAVDGVYAACHEIRALGARARETGRVGAGCVPTYLLKAAAA